MLFMGEEWGATSPFPFFCDFSGDLADAVRKGRRDEFKRFPQFQDPAQRDRIPDPLAQGTFASTKLAWDAVDADHLARTTELLALRRRFVEPLIPHIAHGGQSRVLGEGAVSVVWDAGEAGRLMLVANLSDATVSEPVEMTGEVFLEVGERFSPWSVLWSRERL